MTQDLPEIDSLIEGINDPKLSFDGESNTPTEVKTEKEKVEKVDTKAVSTPIHVKSPAPAHTPATASVVQTSWQSFLKHLKETENDTAVTDKSDRLVCKIDRDLADTLGLSETAVKNKARELGIGKIAKTLWMERAEYVRNHFHDYSFAEMADKLGISKMSVSRIATQLNLRRTKKETFCVSSRVRKDLIRKERRHVVFGLEPVTNIKVVSNRARVRLRAKLKAKGYVVGENSRILYYTNGQRRYEKREKHGVELGLSFLPLPVSGQTIFPVM